MSAHETCRVIFIRAVIVSFTLYMRGEEFPCFWKELKVPADIFWIRNEETETL
jgi:hypothetical protein